MGNFYVNYTLRSSDSAAVEKSLEGRCAYVTSVPGRPVVAYDEVAESQDFDELQRLGLHLSKSVKCPVLAVLNHDDDILMCFLFDSGQCVDEYNSCPDYFEAEEEPRGPIGGDAAKLCQAFGSTKTAEVEAILRNDDYTFAFERHEDLTRALGLPTFGVASGFGYISRGELPQGISEDNLIKVG